jgi:sulfur-oxidizing protein SoxX
MTKLISIASVAFCGFAFSAQAAEIAPTDVVYNDGAVETSLSGVAGNADEGAILMNKGAGNCIACHEVSALSHLPFHGEIGPILDGAASRWTEAELRGIVANAKNFFPDSMMPSLFKSSNLSNGR